MLGWRLRLLRDEYPDPAASDALIDNLFRLVANLTAFRQNVDGLCDRLRGFNRLADFFPVANP